MGGRLARLILVDGCSFSSIAALSKLLTAPAGGRLEASAGVSRLLLPRRLPDAPEGAHPRGALWTPHASFLARGLTSHVEDAAEAAGVSRATAYRYSPNQRGFGSCYLWLPRAANGRATLICVNARAGPPDPGRPNLSPPPDTRSAFSEQVSCPEQQQRR